MQVKNGINSIKFSRESPPFYGIDSYKRLVSTKNEAAQFWLFHFLWNSPLFIKSSKCDAHFWLFFFGVSLVDAPLRSVRACSKFA
ncbi:hypothetical protein B1R32_11228 [Abditibacterium utsteinense]|uniref:Uncharacterized protein n=1 Tax=Abditibacterium utsteinense TaxID=1960156 RepID=A0A2S8SRE0_9BACT|nr:hypothetical protein B1R32_11228 [Abditibacterium utsteinense]